MHAPISAPQAPAAPPVEKPVERPVEKPAEKPQRTAPAVPVPERRERPETAPVTPVVPWERPCRGCLSDVSFPARENLNIAI